MDQTRSDRFLARAMLANAGFSASSGVISIVGASVLASWLGISGADLVVLGVSLLIFAFTLWRAARGPSVILMWARIAVALDLAWVVGSVNLLGNAPASLTSAGWWTIAIVADLVAVFAVLQLYGLWRVRGVRQPSKL